MKNKKYDVRKVISKEERLALIGLMQLAHEAYLKMSECSDAMEKLVGNKNKYSTPLSDEYFEKVPNVDEVLKTMGIKVK